MTLRGVKIMAEKEYFYSNCLIQANKAKLKNPKHGLCVKFIPSSKYLKGDVNLETYMIEDYLRKMSYIMRDDIKIKLYEFSKDMDKNDYEKGKPSTTIKYKRQGLSENVKYISSNLEFSPVEFGCVTEDFDIDVSALERQLDKIDTYLKEEAPKYQRQNLIWG